MGFSSFSNVTIGPETAQRTAQGSLRFSEVLYLHFFLKSVFWNFSSVLIGPETAQRTAQSSLRFSEVL